MEWIDSENAADYLKRQGLIPPREDVTVRPLTGGVSNVVLYVECGGPLDRRCFVLKQARERLRVKDDWRCPVERIWREADVLRVTARLIEADAGSGDLAAARKPLQARTPKILFEDRPNFLITMTAAPPDHRVWKAMLLAGDFDSAIASACGHLLGVLHGRSWRDEALAKQLGDWDIFDRLRIDPYYRKIVSVHGEIASRIERLIQSMERHRCGLVHADFSPKNLLVHDGGLMMVDYETGHFGDPAFDLGFFLSHLVLKAFFHAPRHEPLLVLSEIFFDAYRRRISQSPAAESLPGIEARGNLHFAACGLARLDGKSPVEYLEDSLRRDQMRRLCKSVLQIEPATWVEVLVTCRDLLAS